MALHLERDGRGPPWTMSVILWPAQVRRAFESSVMILLAGELAARVYGADFTDAHDDRERTERVSNFKKLAPLTQRETGRLRDAEAKKLRSDREQAADLLALLADKSAPVVYEHLLELETRSLLLWGRVRTLIFALVPALLEHEVLSARAVREIFRSADTEYRPRLEVAARTKEG